MWTVIIAIIAVFAGAGIGYLIREFIGRSGVGAAGGEEEAKKPEGETVDAEFKEKK